MKKFMLLMATLVISASALACDCQKSQTTQKDSTSQKMNSALKSQSPAAVKTDKQQVSFVYGGQDITPHRTALSYTAFA